MEEIKGKKESASGSRFNEKEILSRARSGEEDALEALFAEYRDKIYRIVYGWCFDSEAAMDLTQDVFFKAFKSMDSFKEESSFYTWLCRIAINRGMDYQREKKRNKEIQVEEQEEFERVGQEQECPDSSAQVSELKSDLKSAIDSLSTESRSAFMLRFFDELSYKEIAGMLDCSVGTVMSRIYYARQKLKDLLKGHLST